MKMAMKISMQQFFEQAKDVKLTSHHQLHKQHMFLLEPCHLHSIVPDYKCK